MITIRTLATMGIGLLIAATAGSALAVPYTPVLDEFWIMKNSAEIYRDSFTDGVPPPSGPDDGLFNSDTYSVIGPGGITGESLGKLTMTPLNGTPTGISGTFS